MKLLKLLKPYAAVNPGEIAGFDDDEAHRLIQRGFAVPAGEPEGVVQTPAQRVERGVEVLGLTDRDPGWIERHEADQAHRGLDEAPEHRMMDAPPRRQRKGGR